MKRARKKHYGIQVNKLINGSLFSTVTLKHFSQVSNQKFKQIF